MNKTAERIIMRKKLKKEGSPYMSEIHVLKDDPNFEL